MDEPLPPPEGARKALIDAALRLFGAKGFAATSTREITAEAGVNLALIAYHFGGKEGLRLACGVEIARRMKAVAGTPQPTADLTPEAARARLERLVQSLVHFLCTAEQAAPMVAFMLQEVIHGGPVLDAVYDGFFADKHSEIAALWALASGRAPDEAARLQVFALVGQIVYFRLAQRLITRRMGWARIGPAEARRIADLITSNLSRLLEAP